MKTHFLALLVGVTALVLSTTSTQAQANCAERDQVLERLSARYGESRQSVGVAANQSLVEVFANSGTGSWSITVTMPNGTTCLVASGTSYEGLALVQPSAMGQTL
ncbi:MAG: hypothetical protein MK180_13860 [Rhodobacteraceae bacterium]|nr:hypothetical protein [Paracoccaceae bacterium]